MKNQIVICTPEAVQGVFFPSLVAYTKIQLLFNFWSFLMFFHLFFQIFQLDVLTNCFIAPNEINTPNSILERYCKCYDFFLKIWDLKLAEFGKKIKRNLFSSNNAQTAI